MEDKKVLFEVKDLKMYFPARGGKTVKAVDGVSFNIYEGETFGVVGESGCGKTTVGRTLLGVYQATAGDIIYKGKNVRDFNGDDKMSFSKNCQMIFQDPAACLDPRMSIGTIVSEGLNVHYKSMTREQKEERVNQVLSYVGLTSDYASRFAHELSGGQRQRIGIARALAIEPSFIVCDEPIAALDVSIQAQVVNLLTRLQKELGLTYMFISHDLSMVRHISDRIAVMYLGSLVELGDNKSIYGHPVHPYTQALFSAIPEPDPYHSWLKNRVHLQGEIPSPINAPAGCKFCTRCPKATDRCKVEAPALREVEPGHYAACHMLDI
ncbi:MAG: ATP-binding cassette domain-containing protein [Firmicutes bacterium]|nr:ATP-binding cassette domain-containing protein [Bacillota bacterium]MBQ5436386.1 ATP-binding cassette domain-containing protein [Bacillota bacterium]MBQ6014221.1 ATP-binding cassette domain-containing protein [Bacillota bacterium]MBQ6261009.1 ATP-binding cassette domain-containing protein [Bacillota bacterium]MBR0115595.1 ATP-binding cassette domain-containing protein [Bacillota bacterium]